MVPLNLYPVPFRILKTFQGKSIFFIRKNETFKLNCQAPKDSRISRPKISVVGKS